MAKVKEARKEILEALQKATFATAAFGSVCTSDYKETNRICKEETRLYRESWLIPPLVNALIAIDPCPHCKGNGKVYTNTARMEGGTFTMSAACDPCKGSGISGGLPFDPYELSREGVEKARSEAEQQRKAREEYEAGRAHA